MKEKIKIKGMKPVEVISLIVMMGCLIAPWFIAGLNIWGWFAVCVAAVTIGFEIYSVIKNDKTISQIFWEFRDEHPVYAWIVFLIASLGWIILGYHILF